MKKLYLLLLSTLLFIGCTTISPIEGGDKDTKPPKNSVTLLFSGDVMAHNVNYNMNNYDIIWDDLREDFHNADFVFMNIEAPVDSTQEPSSYPRFNMPESFVQAAVDAGANVFSLCNNHTNDKNLSGIKETIKTTNRITENEKNKKNNVYFSGLKENSTDSYSFNILEKNGWKILFLPMTEILNQDICTSNINYISTSQSDRNKFIEYCKKLKEENKCDLFILSFHAYETEYVRDVKKSQEKFYNDLLEAGIDIIWANHAHIIKDRKVMINSETKSVKIIMYANGNTISGQRTKPNLTSSNPNEERDNTGDGLIYKVVLTKKDKKSSPQIFSTENIFITTYITPNREYVIKKMNQDFIDELRTDSKNNWANYIEKRLKINQTYSKEIIEWQ